MPGFVVNGLGGGAPSSVQPYYKYTWEVTQVLGDVIGLSSSGKLSPGKMPLVYIKDATLPDWSLDREEIQGSSLVYKFAKTMKWEDVKITWYDTVGLASLVRAWRESIWTPDGGLANPDDYKRESIIRSLTFAWKKPVIWKLINSWPTSVKTSDLTYADSDVKSVTVNLAYDWAEDSTES